MTLQEYIELYYRGGNLFQSIEFVDPYNEAKLLESFCKTDISKKRIKRRFIEALSTILNAMADAYYPHDVTNCFTEETLAYLIEHNIALTDLAHLQLSDAWLQRIFDKDNSCVEALQTIQKRRAHVISK